MRLISTSDFLKTYAWDKEKYTIKFTLGNQQHYENNKQPQWKVIKIECESTEVEEEPIVFAGKSNRGRRKSCDSSKNFKCNFVFDRSGRIVRCVLEDSNKLQRIREYYYDLENIDESDMNSLRVKGMVKEDTRWVKDSLSLPQSPVMYYFDKKSRKFVSDKGVTVVAQTILTNLELPQILESAGIQVSEKFMDLIKGKNEPPDEIDIAYGIEFD